MLLTAAVATVTGAALALVLGTCVTFGHKYSDRVLKLDDKSSGDELNELLYSIRVEETGPVLSKLWAMFTEVSNQNKGIDYDAAAIFSDIGRRDRLNTLVGALESTYAGSLEIIRSREDLRKWYGNLSLALYLFAAIEGVVGYGLLLLGLQDTISFNSFDFLMGISVLIAVALVFVAYWRYCRSEVKRNNNIYYEAKKKYLMERVRVPG